MRRYSVQLAARKTTGTSLTATSSNPAPRTSSSIRAGSPRKNWPGSSGFGGSSRPRSISTGPYAVAHGFRFAGAQVANASRPPGLSTRRVSRSASAGSGTSMYP